MPNDRGISMHDDHLEPDPETYGRLAARLRDEQWDAAQRWLERRVVSRHGGVELETFGPDGSECEIGLTVTLDDVGPGDVNDSLAIALRQLAREIERQSLIDQGAAMERERLGGAA